MPFSAKKTWELKGVDGARWITNWGAPFNTPMHLQFYKKCFWPELTGNHFLNAKQIVAREAPLSEVICRSTDQIKQEGQKTTPDGLLKMDSFNPKRVVIWYEPSLGRVVQTPFRG